MSELTELTQLILEFRDKRDWKQFHTPKNLAESLVLEASEVLEHFQWKTNKEIKEHLAKNKKDFSYELADVLSYLLLLAEVADIDLANAFKAKLKISDQKYPVSKAKGSATKYTKLSK